MHFARFLRSAGLAIGPGRVIEALRAVEAVGLGRRDDFYWALHAVFVSRPDQHELFDQAFLRFWRHPDRWKGDVRRRTGGGAPAAASEEDRELLRLTEAWRRAVPAEEAPESAASDSEVDALLTYSPGEVLRTRDFAEMTSEELRLAREAIRRLRLPVASIPTRRYRVDPRGTRVDLRATLRATVRTPGGEMVLRWRSRRRRPPPIVFLCDVSGSMSRYSRVLLHFAHAVARGRAHVHTFVFGTRLTNVTRQLRHRDVDEALRRTGATVEDWSGGTRIGASLEAFNRLWSRRVLAQGAIVILVTDGLDREAGRGLRREIERLHRSCRRLIWLNPLLRYPDFEPLAHGIKAMLPHVDEHRPTHDLRSLEALVAALAPAASARPAPSKALRP